MISVRIGTEERVCPVDPNWVNQQVKGRRADGAAPCVRVTIKTSEVDLTFATAACGGGGGGRAPNPRERELFELWTKHQLDQPNFSGGQLVAFLKQVGCS